jgi:hypothetical protein
MTWFNSEAVKKARKVWRLLIIVGVTSIFAHAGLLEISQHNHWPWLVMIAAAAFFVGVAKIWTDPDFLRWRQD